MSRQFKSYRENKRDDKKDLAALEEVPQLTAGTGEYLLLANPCLRNKELVVPLSPVSNEMNVWETAPGN